MVWLVCLLRPLLRLLLITYDYENKISDLWYRLKTPTGPVVNGPIATRLANKVAPAYFSSQYNVYGGSQQRDALSDLFKMLRKVK